MKLRLPNGFLEALFHDDTYMLNIEQTIDNIKVKMINAPDNNSIARSMPNTTKKIQEILEKNIQELKQAYYEDLKNKFPGNLFINLQTLEVKFGEKNGRGYLIDNKYLTKVLKDALSKYTNRNNLAKTGQGINELIKSYIRILSPFFYQHGWIKTTENGEGWNIKIKDANQLQIIFSQILFLLENDTSLDQHLVANWKEFFDK